MINETERNTDMARLEDQRLLTGGSKKRMSPYKACLVIERCISQAALNLALGNPTLSCINVSTLSGLTPRLNRNNRR